MTQEREAKRQYKEAFEALAKAKAKMEASAKQEEGLRRDLIDSFDSYLEAKVSAAKAPRQRCEGFFPCVDNKKRRSEFPRAQ